MDVRPFNLTLVPGSKLPSKSSERLTAGWRSARSLASGLLPNCPAVISASSLGLQKQESLTKALIHRHVFAQTNDEAIMCIVRSYRSGGMAYLRSHSKRHWQTNHRHLCIQVQTSRKCVLMRLVSPRCGLWPGGKTWISHGLSTRMPRHPSDMTSLTGKLSHNRAGPCVFLFTLPQASTQTKAMPTARADLSVGIQPPCCMPQQTSRPSRTARR